MITWSEDGRDWVKPETIFPAHLFRNRSKDNRTQYSIAHQRMAFYVTSDNRLLVSMTNFSRYGSGDNGCLKGDGDLPGADDPVKTAIFDIDDFQTSGANP